ncbi:MAG: DUF3014 domain-containing protein [Acidobacteriota bacterium]
MDPLDDIQIDAGLEQPESPEPPVAGRSAWPVAGAVVVVLVVASLTGWYLWFRTPASDRPAATAQSTPQSAGEVRAPLGPPVEAIDLPPLFLTDPLVRNLIGRLSTRPEVMAWMATDGLIRNLVVCIENVASSQSLSRHLARLAPNAPFRAVRRNGTPAIDPASCARYNGIADAAASLNAAGIARAYSTLKPRLVEAYRELGHPDGDIDGATERAITILLKVPLVEGDIVLGEQVISYRFQNEDLEQLDPAQKQLLRMGARNQRIIQEQLRAVASQLGVPEKRLPATPVLAGSR